MSAGGAGLAAISGTPGGECESAAAGGAELLWAANAGAVAIESYHAAPNAAPDLDWSTGSPESEGNDVGLCF
jgi:hypothetical protein